MPVVFVVWLTTDNDAIDTGTGQVGHLALPEEPSGACSDRPINCSRGVLAPSTMGVSATRWVGALSVGWWWGSGGCEAVRGTSKRHLSDKMTE